MKKLYYIFTDEYFLPANSVQQNDDQTNDNCCRLPAKHLHSQSHSTKNGYDLISN